MKIFHHIMACCYLYNQQNSMLKHLFMIIIVTVGNYSTVIMQTMVQKYVNNGINNGRLTITSVSFVVKIVYYMYSVSHQMSRST